MKSVMKINSVIFADLNIIRLDHKKQNRGGGRKKSNKQFINENSNLIIIIFSKIENRDRGKMKQRRRNHFCFSKIEKKKNIVQLYYHRWSKVQMKLRWLNVL